MLLEEITQKLKVTYRSTHTPAPIKLATFLAFIASGAQKSSDGTEYPSKSLVSKIICEMLDIFEEHLYPKWVKFEKNQEDENLTKEYFYNKTGIAGIVGCVANTQVRIKTPAKEVRHLYKNSKGYSSLNVMLICDHNMAITYVDANQPGSFNNAYVWDHSSADNYLRTNYLNGKVNTWVIGNSTYKLLPYMMTPYRNQISDHQQLFNEKHWEIRDITKQCINIMKNRFRCLITPTGLQYIPEKAVKIVITCCILHNICIAYKQNWQPCDTCGDDIVNEGDMGTIETTGDECALSNFIRDEIARNLYCLQTNSFVS
ncbi:putative nuclease HARBI1 [Calliphora vicina]|uniref:putative nuclease HARBI1 n=1 Tax=Calliphora vicina TaxID=7373 RepID=UPI00325BF3F1